VMDTAAAHEMLHVAYEHLDSRERTRIDKLLAKVLAGHDHEELSEKLKSYGKAGGAQLRNELHSFVGTEILHLPPELESYYAQYFTNRRKIVSLFKKPETEFENHGNEIKEYDQKLSVLRSEINIKNSQGLKMSKDLVTLQNLQESYCRKGDAQNCNELAAKMNNKIIAYNKVAQESQTAVRKYNELVKRRNGIAKDSNSMAEMMGALKETSSLNH